MKATIYIPEEKYPLYEKAKETLKDSISETFLRCLQRELDNQKLKSERIIIELRNPETGRVSKKAFEGSWLLGSDSDPEQFLFDKETTGISGGGHYAVARTRKGALAVMNFDIDGDADYFKVYQSFDEFASASDGGYPGYPEALVSAVAAELDIERIEDLDI